MFIIFLLSVIALFCGMLSADQESNKKQMTIVACEIIQKIRTADAASKKIDTLNRLDNESFKAAFGQLHQRAKMLYLLHLDIDQYEQFLQRFEGEAAWSAYCKDNNCSWLPSWTKQMELVRDCYYDYYVKSFYVSLRAENKTACPTDDIAQWKKYYHTNNDNRFNAGPFAKERRLAMEFYRQKLKLLNIP